MSSSTSPARVSSLPGIALVTGASSGIGQAAAVRLADLGWTVVGVGRDATRLQAAMAHAPARMHAIEVDLTAPNAPAQVLSQLDTLFGADGPRVQALVNAAGILRAGPFAQMSMEVVDEVMDTNVRSLWALTQALYPHLLANAQAGRDAAVINVSSVAGPRAYPNLAAYCVSKAAVDALTRCLAIEWAPAKIRVNAVNPGVVVTALHRSGGMDADAYASFLERGQQTHPLGRVGDVDEVAGLVAFLLGPDAGWITGETVLIDGGRHLTSLR